MHRPLLWSALAHLAGEGRLPGDGSLRPGFPVLPAKLVSILTSLSGSNARLLPRTVEGEGVAGRQFTGRRRNAAAHLCAPRGSSCRLSAAPPPSPRSPPPGSAVTSSSLTAPVPCTHLERSSPSAWH